MRHGCYRQFICWQHCGLGEGIRRVTPNCCVWKIRAKYPEPSGQYTGFMHYIKGKKCFIKHSIVNSFKFCPIPGIILKLGCSIGLDWKHTIQFATKNSHMLNTCTGFIQLEIVLLPHTLGNWQLGIKSQSLSQNYLYFFTSSANKYATRRVIHVAQSLKTMLSNDPEPLKRMTELAQDDPRRVMANIASIVPEPTATLASKQRSRYNKSPSN